MVGCLFYKNGGGSGGDVEVDTATVPWIVFTVDPHDVCVVEEIPSRISTTKEIKRIIVLRRQAILLLAVLRKLSLKPIRPHIRRLISVITHRHREFITSLNIPPIIIECAALLSDDHA